METSDNSFSPKLLDHGPLFNDEKVKEKEPEAKESVEVVSELPGDVYEDSRAIDLGADGKERPIGRSTTVKSDLQKKVILTFCSETDMDVATRLISLEDDPSLPAFTFRLWFLGLGLSCFGAVLGQIFVRTSDIAKPHSILTSAYQYFRPQTVYVSPLFLQIISYILGVVLEEVIPGPFNPRFTTRNNAFWRFMNPGPFSKSLIFARALHMYLPLSYLDIKEHVAITIFSTTASESALAISIFAADELFYNIEVSSIKISP